MNKEIIKLLDAIDEKTKRLDMGNVIFKELTGHYTRLKIDIRKDIATAKKLLKKGMQR